MPKKADGRQTAKPTWLEIGRIGKAHGLRGYFFVAQRYQDFSVEAGADVMVGPPSDRRTFLLEATRMQGQRPLAKLEGIESREDLESLTGLQIWVERDQVEVDSGKEYLWTDVIGKRVLSLDERELGIVVSMNNFGASDVVSIKSTQGPQSFLDIPFVATYFDMSFQAKDPTIKIVVPLETFEELWYE